MTDQTQKLEKFKQAVFNEAAAKADEIIKETEQHCSGILAQAEADARKFVSESRAKAEKEYKETSQRTESAGRLELRRKLLNARQEVIDKVFSNVREKLEAFRESAAYERLLVKRAEECAAAYPGKRGEVRVAAADMKYAAKLTCGGRFTVCESRNILLGGIMVVFPEDNLALDCTFDNEFDRQKSGFAGKAGLVFDM